MAGTPKRIGPAYLTTAVANLYTPGSNNRQLTHIHVENTDVSAQTFSMWIGATGASAGGTELFKDQTVPAKSAFDYYTDTFMGPTAFLTGSCASSSVALVFTIDCEESVP